MARITQGNKLYLYQLLSREIGVGRQTLLSRVEEVLEADDILPCDLECASVRELLEELGEFVRLSVFKKGRVYATVLPHAAWDELLTHAQDDPKAKQPTPKSGGQRSWKRKKASKDPRPAKPRPCNRPKPEAEKDEAQSPAKETMSQPAPEEAPAAAPAPEASPVANTAPAPVATPGNEPEPGSEPAVAPEPEPAVTPEPEPAVAPEPEAAPEPEPAPAPTQEDSPQTAASRDDEPAPAGQPKPSIVLTITYDPAEDQPSDETEHDREETPLQAQLQPLPANPPAPQASAQELPTSLQRDLPRQFSADVLCKDEHLRLLYQILPFDTDPLSMLDEDWRVAKSTGMLSGSRARVTFPLRFVHEDDASPVQVSIRRAPRTGSGKRWVLASVDDNDGRGSIHEAVGVEGLPTADDGAWSDLTPNGGLIGGAMSPIRELAQHAFLGSWDALLGRLAAMAAPERWNYAGEGVGKPSRYGILREYLSVTFCRVRAEGKLAVSDDESFSAFDTGLLTPFAQNIYMCLEAQRGDIPWRHVGFCTAGSGELGVRLTSLFDPLPQPAEYLLSLGDVTPSPGRMVILDTETLLGRQLCRLPRAFLDEQLAGSTVALEALDQTIAGGPAQALARAIRNDPGLYRRINNALSDAVDLSLARTRRSYRLAAPAWDPKVGQMRLLLPLYLADYRYADCALVLAPQKSGNYLGTSIMTLERAYACARVVSAEQPQWLVGH